MNDRAAETVHAAKEFLSQAGERGWTVKEFAHTRHRSEGSVRRLLRHAGISWHKLKRAERLKRLAELSARPGRLRAMDVYREFGYSNPNAFGRFFTEEIGEPFRDWLQRRQCL